MNKLEQFIQYFKSTPIWARMVATVEDSPWHREANTAVHTEMCIDMYKTKFAPFRSEKQNTIAIIALLFHDVGKPEAEEVLDRKDGAGQYRRYAGHEPVSATTFVECYVTMPLLRELLTKWEARAIRWCIENHLPYGMTNPIKRQALRNSTILTFKDIDLNDDTFFDCLRSDASGRISDDHEAKLVAVEEWIQKFKTIEFNRYSPTVAETTMYILVGPSGSGKSTWTREKIATTGDRFAAIISQDAEKDVFYSTMFPDAIFENESKRYAAVWEYCTISPGSSAAYRKFFDAQVKIKMDAARTTMSNVFIDIVNGSKKKRQMWVDLAKRYKMRVIAVEFWSPIGTLIARQVTRGDKYVPTASIKTQMSAMSSVWLGTEADMVIMKENYDEPQKLD